MTIFISIFVYLFTGYLIGKTSNKEYFDDTETKNLNILRKLKRRILFPISYGEWHDREKNQGNIGPSVREITNSHRTWLVDHNEKDYCRVEDYCKVTAFLWPLKLIQAGIGMGIIIYNCMFNILKVVAQIPAGTFYALESGSKQIRITSCKIRTTLTGTGSDIIVEIDEIQKRISEQKKVLDERLSSFETRKKLLDNNLSEWISSSKNKQSQSLAKANESVIASLQTESDQITVKRDKIKKLIQDLSEKESQLSDSLRTLRLCQKTREFNITAVVPSTSGGLIKSDALAIISSDMTSLVQAHIAGSKELLDAASEI